MTSGTPSWTYAVVSDEVGSDFAEVVKLAKQLGFEQIALNSLWHKMCPQLSRQELRQAKSLLDEQGLIPSAFGTLFFKALPLDVADFDQQAKSELDQFRASCELAKLVDAPMIRIFTFRRPEADQDPPTPVIASGGVLEDRQVDQIASVLGPAADAAAELGLLVGLENVRSCFGNTGEHTAAIARAIGRDNVKIVWDPGNHHVSCGRPILEGYEAVKPYLLSIDVKNARILDALRGETVWAPIGEGDIDYGPQLDELVGTSYQGNLTVETHWRGPGLPAAVATAFSFAQLRMLAAQARRA